MKKNTMLIRLLNLYVLVSYLHAGDVPHCPNLPIFYRQPYSSQDLFEQHIHNLPEAVQHEARDEFLKMDIVQRESLQPVIDLITRYKNEAAQSATVNRRDEKKAEVGSESDKQNTHQRSTQTISAPRSAQ